MDDLVQIVEHDAGVGYGVSVTQTFGTRLLHDVDEEW